MKIINLVFLGVLVIILSVSFSGNVFAQEEVSVDDEYTWGTVVKVSSSQIIITEFDTENNETEATYVVDSNVKLSNIDNLLSLNEGDIVDITYIIKNDEMVVLTISLDVNSYSDAEIFQEAVFELEDSNLVQE